MAKVNNQFLTLLIVALSLGIVMLLTSQKFLMTLMQKGVTSCQEFLQTFSLPLPHHTQSVLLAILLFIITGSIVKLLFSVVKIYQFHIRLQENLLSPQVIMPLLTKLHLTEKTVLIQSDKPFAFCFGVIHPKIYLSTAAISLLSTKELKAVLWHEEAHLTNHDTISLFLISLIQSLFPFFPLFSDIVAIFLIEREIRADQDAIKKLHSPQPLITALSKLLRQDVLHQFTYAPAIADETTLEKRISYLTTRKKINTSIRPRHVVVSLIFVFFLLLSLFTPLQAVEVHHEQHDTLLLATQSKVKTVACQSSVQVKTVAMFYLTKYYPIYYTM